MSADVQSVLASLFILGIAAVVALILTVRRDPSASTDAMRARTTWLFLVAVGFQLIHFLEEYSGGFHQLWPALWGQRPWPAAFFITFNLTWIGIWLLCAIGIRRGVRIAFFPVWFFAIAMTINGVGHPALALWVDGYFPGLYTSPVVGVLGVLLLIRLSALTGPVA